MCYLFLYPDEGHFKDYKFEVLNPGKNNKYFGYKLYKRISDNLSKKRPFLPEVQIRERNQ